MYLQGTSLVLSNSVGANYFVAYDGGSVNLYHNANQKLATTSGGVQITGTLDVDVISNASGVVHLNDTLYFQDNSKAVFGDSSDLQIYHDGTDSFVRETGTGNLRLQGTNLNLQNEGGTKNYLVAVNSGAVQLYHNNNSKIQTTSSGANITGTLTSDGLSTSANTALVGEGASGGSTQLIYWNGTNAYYGRSSLVGSVAAHEFRSGVITRLTVN